MDKSKLYSGTQLKALALALALSLLSFAQNSGQICIEEYVVGGYDRTRIGLLPF